MSVVFKNTLSTLLVGLSLFYGAARAEEEPVKSAYLDLEGSAVWQSYNRIKIPDSVGTSFRYDSFGKGPKFAGRIYAGWLWGDEKQHELRALYAPLSLRLADRKPYGIYFAGKDFPPGVDTETRYTFNSYRLTYRYTWTLSERWKIKTGFTAKIRQAEIWFKQQVVGSASRKNIGFVPLLNVAFDYSLSPEWTLGTDIDALGSKYGRAEDILLFVRHEISERYFSKFGIRSVEGGSDGGGGVYNFAWFNFAVLSLGIKF